MPGGDRDAVEQFNREEEGTDEQDNDSFNLATIMRFVRLFFSSVRDPYRPLPPPYANAFPNLSCPNHVETALLWGPICFVSSIISSKKLVWWGPSVWLVLTL